MNKNCFFPQDEPKTAELCSPVVWKQFRANSLKNFLFSPNSDYLRKEHRNTQKVCFSLPVRKGANPEENLDLLNKYF